jgi:hypothetical protein
LVCALIALLASAGLAFAQTPPQDSAFEARVDDMARALSGEPDLKRLSPRHRRALVEFVMGNILFVATHEIGHALVSEMKLPVLGREEDAADDYAILAALRLNTSFSFRILEGAAKGWFLSAERDKKEGYMPEYYDRHGLNQQRAYQIVCLMVGSDPAKFKRLADETKLPDDRRRTCGWDYDTALGSWETVLAQHRLPEDQPSKQVEVRYGEAKGKLEVYARSFRAARFLEIVVEDCGVSRYAWPAPITIEMRSCGESGARWTIGERRLHICYELAQEFAELYRDYGLERKPAKRNSRRRS